MKFLRNTLKVNFISFKNRSLIFILTSVIILHFLFMMTINRFRFSAYVLSFVFLGVFTYYIIKLKKRIDDSRFDSFTQHPDLLFILDEKFQIININKKALEASDYKNKCDLLGRSFLDIIFPKNKKYVKNHLRKVLSDKNIYNINFKLDPTMGRLLPLTGRLMLLEKEDKNYILVNCRYYDDTESDIYKKYTSFSRLVERVVDCTPDMLWAKDLNGKYLFTNSTLRKKILSANDKKEPIGKNFEFFKEREKSKYPKDRSWHTFNDSPFVDRIDLECIGEEKPVQFDSYGKIKGKDKHLDIYITPLYDENKQLIGTVGSARDVTMEKEVQGELVRERNQFRQFIDFNPYAIAILDEHGHIIQVNNAYHALFKAEVPQEYSIFTDKSYLKQDFENKMFELKNGEVIKIDELWHNFSMTIPKMEDRGIWVSLLAFPIKDDDFQIDCFVAMFQDISQEINLRKEKRKEKEKLKENFINSLNIIQMDHDRLSKEVFNNKRNSC